MRAGAFAVGLVAFALVASHARAEDACVDAYVHSQEVRLQKRYVRARELFEKCAANACPGALRKDCTTWLKEVDQILPSVVVVPRDQNGADVASASVTVDGASVPASTAFALDPGPHRIRCEKAGSVAGDLEVTIQEGEKNRVIACVLSPAQPHEATTAPSASVPVGSWVAGGLGLVLIGVGAYSAAAGVSERSSLVASGCAAKGTCASSSVDAAKAKLAIADGTITSGIAGLGIAVILYFVQRPKPPDPATPHVTVSHVRGGGVVGLRGAF